MEVIQAISYTIVQEKYEQQKTHGSHRVKHQRNIEQNK